MADTKQQKSNKALLEELGVEVSPIKKAAYSAKEERIIAGFEEIQRFVEEHGHQPQHGEDKDIFERLYATRLDRIRSLEECRNLVEALDYQGLLTPEQGIAEARAEYKTDAELLDELGITAPKESDVTFLKHVKPRAEVRAAEEIASRTPCADFDKFKPLFDQVQDQLTSGLLEAKVLKSQKGQSTMAEINQGDWFIVNGQKAYIADISKERIYGFDKNDYRLRVIFDNKTESDLLLRSMQKALYVDEASRRIVSLSAGPLFDSVMDDEDIASGTIYVLRSKSEHTTIAENRNLIHKIGVTGGSVKTRIANARQDPTYLMAEVDVVATYELYNINRTKLEHLLHRFFEPSKLEIQINDRFGNPVIPREWFFVPLFIIDEVVEKIKDGSISQYRYDAKNVKLVTA
ncbi:GIY-YIG nuclease family protein [Marinomonas spartinae]|uniref:GIY-YIG nuclease family protein n=1 Tax=Marinomonas spartinae TaxID=1792290 RepID=UPI0018F17B7D|nr:GIY-YIG nuclease family protein [Marinomonas spartinae]MBJ7555453.1 GIY-YIG nuclease family protein [Marinomonas spartinae]